MDGLEFINAPPAAPPDPARADIACFVGLVARRRAGTLDDDRVRLQRCLNQLGWQGPRLALSDEPRLLPAFVLPVGDSHSAFVNWLQGLGWMPAPFNPTMRPPILAGDLFQALLGVWFDETVAGWFKDRGLFDPASGYAAADLLELLDLPVPIGNWNTFDLLFAWDARAVENARIQPGTSRTADTLLGAAVRSFFRQGGRKCYVVRVDDPTPVFSFRAERARLPAKLLPEIPPSLADRRTWRGIGNLFGLPEVSFLCLPDAPELFAANTQSLPIHADPQMVEHFVECAGRADPPSFQSLRSIPAPRCDAAGFASWAQFASSVGILLGRQAREVQFVASVPLPVNEVALAGDPAILARPPADRQLEIASRISAARTAQWSQIASTIQSAFVQLSYPWLRTRDSAALPEEIEPPDGTLAGLLANVALTRGAWRTPAREAVPGLRAVEPVLAREDLDRPLPFRAGVSGPGTQPPGYLRTVRARISVFGPTAIGLRLLSDVTTAGDEAWRPAGVNRLMNVIVRTARRAGEEFVFAKSDERLWGQVVDSLTSVLTQLWADGALDGTTAAEAFDVRCDLSTMTQADLDGGRLVARVQFTAAAPIDRIVAVLAMSEGGQVSLLSAGRAAPAPAKQEAA